MLNLEQLNVSQRRAVTHGEGPLLVLAGPGSGKTTVVIQRIFYLLERKMVPPEKILVITFTKQAALSMQSRFYRQAGVGAGANIPVNFGTFHSIFYHILKKSHVLKSNQIMFAVQKKKLLLPIVGKYYREEQGSIDVNTPGTAGKENAAGDATAAETAADELLGAIGYYKNTGNMAAAKRKVSPSRQKSFENIFREYERVRKSRGGMDFDDMVYECGKMLETDKALRSLWQERYDYILLDEFQDINPSQYKVVSLLAKPPYSLFAVGDDDQSIYSFRGADFSCLKRFEEEFLAEKLLLDINYRSSQEIVDSSLKVIGENKSRYPKKLYAWKEKCRECQPEQSTSLRKKNYGVKISFFGTQEAQYQDVACRLCQAPKSQSRAVLFRTNLQMQRFAVTLDKRNIPYIMKEKSESIYEHFIVKDIMSYLGLAAGEWSREAFLRIMNKPFRYISREAVGENAGDISQMLHHIRNGGEKQCTDNKMRMFRALEKLKTQLDYIGQMPLYLGVQYIKRAMGYDVYLKKLSEKKPEKYEGWQEILDWLGADAAGYESLEKWKETQRSYAQSLQEMKQENNLQDSAVWLMTVHGAKGLEFDSVWIPDCNEGIYPHGNLCSVEECEEERRIFYVAMTRAKENLELSYLTGTGKRPRLPSRFLNPLF